MSGHLVAAPVHLEGGIMDPRCLRRFARNPLDCEWNKGWILRRSTPAKHVPACSRRRIDRKLETLATLRAQSCSEGCKKLRMCSRSSALLKTLKAAASC